MSEPLPTSETLPPPAPSEGATLAYAPPIGSPANSREAVPGYEVLGELGRGGMGVVYQARQVKLNRTVALKMVLAADHAGAADRTRFRTEAEAIARLQHPNIVQVYEVGEHAGRPFLSLEYCPGGTLEQRLHGTPLPPAEAAALVAVLGGAVHAAHQKGVVHRDLKPANVLLTEDGTPKVTDFGLARQLDQVSQTQSGSILGTPSYMAPEQAGGKTKEIGPPTDVYALGAILYECLTGRPPFRAATVMDTLMQVVGVEPVPPRHLQPKVPRDLETICLKCLEKTPARRYATAANLAEDLRRFQAGEPLVARPASSWEKVLKWTKRKPSQAVAVAVIMAAVVALLVGGLAFTNELRQERDAAQLARDEGQQRARELAAAGKELAEQRSKAQAEAKNARQAEQQAKEQQAEAVRLLDRTRRMLMTTQLLNVAAIHTYNPVGALAILQSREACPLEFRDDFAWRFYVSQCKRWRLTWEWPAGAIDALAVSPDGKLLATSKGKTITLWELNTGKRITTLEGHTLTVTRLTFAPNSQRLASGAAVDRHAWMDKATVPNIDSKVPRQKTPDKGVLPMIDEDFAGDKGPAGAEVKLWDVTGAKALFQFAEKAGTMASLVFSADGKALAAGFLFPPSARVWDVAGARELAHLPGLGGYVALAPDATTIAGQAAERRNQDKEQWHLEVWDVAKKERFARAMRWDEMELQGSYVAFTPDGQALALVGDRLRAGLWDWRTNKIQYLASRVPLTSGFITGHSSWQHLRFGRTPFASAPDGKSLATLIAWSNVVVWDAVGRQEAVAIQGTPGEVDAVSYTDDGKGLAILQRSKTRISLRVWSFVQRPEHLVVDGAQGMAFLGKDQGLATIVAGQLKRIDLNTGRAEILADGLKDDSFVIGGSPDGKAIALYSDKNERQITVWDVPSRSPRFAVSGRFPTFSFSPDSTRLVLSSDDGVQLLDALTGKEIKALIAKQKAFCLAAFAPDGKTLATGNGQQPLQLWDLPTGTVRTLSKPLVPLCFVPDSDLLVVVSLGNPAVYKTWDLQRDQEHLELGRAGDAFPFFALSPDGKALATTGADIVVWDTFTGQGRLKIPALEEGLIAFSLDGRFLAFAGIGSQVVRVWDTQPIQEVVIRPVQ
jgi:WD40 repeat protein/tRNA A-37 threonylcarbamoyl transferase component Bud32